MQNIIVELVMIDNEATITVINKRWRKKMAVDF